MSGGQPAGEREDDSTDVSENPYLPRKPSVRKLYQEHYVTG